MIKIKYKNDEHQFVFQSKGHANYDEFGKDIICSAVSSIIIGALNAIKDVDSFEIKILEGEVDIKNKKEISNHDLIVLETMIVQLYTVEAKSKKYLSIEKE